MAKRPSKPGAGPEYRPRKARKASPTNEPRRGLWALGALAAVGGLAGLVARQSATPHFGRATEAEILAALPPALTASEPRDPAAEARFERLARFLTETFRKEDERLKEVSERAAAGRAPVPLPPPSPAERLDRRRRIASVEPVVRRILDEGPIQAPPTGVSINQLSHAGEAVQAEVNVLDAVRRGERGPVLEDALWRLRLADALDRAGRLVGEARGIVDVEIYRKATAADTIYKVEMAGGYDPAGRRRILEALPAQDGRNPALATAVRRTFREFVVPQLFAVGRGTPPWRLPYFVPGYPNRPEDRRAGSIDPLVTARRMGEYVQARLTDLGTPFGQRTDRAQALEREVRERLRREVPEAGVVVDFDSWLAFLQWRDAMNRGANTLGDPWAVSCIPTLSDEERSQAARVNLTRAVLLLHSGVAAMPPDPFGKGALRLDPKRRIVWSVGSNGKDDGGKEWEGEDRFQLRPLLDLVYRY